MTDLAPDVDAEIPRALTAAAESGELAWAAYANLLELLRDTIHLDGPQNPVELAIENLFAIAGAWVGVESPETVLPFSRASEIDIVRTLLSAASYSTSESDFARLSEAFAVAVSSFGPDPSRSRRNFQSFG